MYLDYFLSSYTIIIAQAVIFVKNAYAYTPVILASKNPHLWGLFWGFGALGAVKLFDEFFEFVGTFEFRVNDRID